jgi:hypothetical protein
VVVKRLEELGDNLPLVQRELLVVLVSRLLCPAERHAAGDVDGWECRVA